MATDTRTRRPTSPPPAEGSVAQRLTPLLAATIGDPPPIRFTFWDGSATGPPDGPAEVHVGSATAVRRMLWAPGDLGIGRAYVAGEVAVSGDLSAALRIVRDASPTDLRFGWRLVPAALEAARRVGAIGPPPPSPAEELRPQGIRHSIAGDARAIGHHYDVGNDFYRLVLGPSMTYSCARFVGHDDDLASAQDAKHELVCRKLGLHRRPGTRLLDVGCGWGSMAIHAAARHSARVVGITISQQQAELARERVAAAGVDDRVEIRLQDYRELRGESFEAISSIGMSEHVGSERIETYFRILHDLLEPRGRVLDHAISSPGGSRLSRRSFAGRFVFPDGELLDVGAKQIAMQRAGLEVRDVESLREHYARTLQHWVANLEAGWDRAVELAGVGRARVWRVYMTASAIGFADGELGVHQVLAVRSDADGRSGMPPDRGDWG